MKFFIFFIIILGPVYGEFPWHGLAQLFSGQLTVDDSTETPSPFGEIEEYFPRDKTLSCSCGLSNLPRTIDEASFTDPISPAEIPWLVLIYVVRDSSRNVCSGTIINDRVIVTAASCLVKIPANHEERSKMLLSKSNKFDPSPTKVAVLRATNTTIDLDDNSTYIKLEVEFVTLNPHYVYQTILHDKNDWDIAFIKLKHALIFNETSGFVPVCLPPKYLADKELEKVKMVSFGWKKYTVHDASTFKKSTVYSLKRNRPTHVHSKRICQAITANEWISARHFCTKGPSFIQSKFIESHGGPMLYRLPNRPFQFIQYGIISWDLIGLLIQKKNVRVSSNLSGFLEVIDDFSDSVDAKFCLHDNHENTELQSDAEWTDGLDLDLLEPLKPDMIHPSEWNSITSDYRQHYASSACRCGRSKKKSDGDQEQKYNWDVQVEVKDESPAHFCHGTIINDKVILTTASCLQSKEQFNEEGIESEVEISHNPSHLIVHLNFELPGSNTKTLNVEQIVPHFQFVGTMYEGSEYDVALLILENKLPLQQLKKTMSPVCLPESDSSVIQTKASIIFNSTTSPIEIFEKDFCKQIWKDAEAHAQEEVEITSVEFKNIFHFVTKSCGAVETKIIAPMLKTGIGQPVVSETTSDNNRFDIMTQIGFFSNITNTILKPTNGKHVASDSQDAQFDDKTIVAFNDIKPLLQFIDYFSLIVDAKFCPSGHRL